MRPDMDSLSVTTIRTLAMDAVEKARSGHPGTPMALAPVAYVLWQRFLRYDPADPAWPDRDRFVLSNGHASMLLYALLHLAEVREVGADGVPTGRPAVEMEDLRAFRQLDSRCPGHPEHGRTSGVEATTGPLGQGVAMSVGMAVAARWLARHHNRPGLPLFEHDVYALCGDGDLMEGISGEAASLAGHLRLPNLCWIYDNNHITIEGSTDLAFSEDVAGRFVALGWRVMHVGDANDREAIARSLRSFQEARDRPTLIVVDSHIAWGAPHKQDTAAAHGEPLGEDEVRAAKQSYGWPEDAHFLVPDGVREHFRAGIGLRGARLRREWEERFQAYRASHPDRAGQLERMRRRELPEGWDRDLPRFAPDARGMATRDASGRVASALARTIPWFLGGSADLAPSTRTRLVLDGAGDLGADEPGGRNLHFGIREHAMTGITNGLSLSGLRPFAATFLVFSDYLRPALRLSALMDLPVVAVFTHDSIGLGEDGPTHQPVGQLASLRAMPGLVTIRPADAGEVVEAWRVAMARRHGPVALVLTRQAVPVLDRHRYAPAAGLARGAYVLADAPGGDPELLLLATGSEVHLVLAARETLAGRGVRTRVVSMPSWELFEQQPAAYRESVLPRAVTARVAVEQACTLGWDRYAGPEGLILGMHGFGASAPGPVVEKRFGFTPEAIVTAATALLAGQRGPP